MKKYSLFFIVTLSFFIYGCSGSSPLEKGREAMAKGEYRRAAKYFGKAVSKNSSSAMLYYNLGAACSLSGNSRGAVKAFREALKFAPGDILSAEYLASELRKIGGESELSESHEILDAALGVAVSSGDKARILTSLALTESAVNRDDVAVAHLLLARNTDPGYAPALYNLAKICSKNSILYSRAYALMGEFISMPGVDPGYKALANKFLTEYASRDIAVKNKNTRTSDEVSNLMAKGVADYRSAYQSNNQTKKTEKYELALKSFAKAMELDPESYEVAYSYASALYSLKKYSVANLAFIKAGNLDNEKYEPFYWQVRIAYSAGDYARVTEIISGIIIPKWPDELQTYNLASSAYYHIGKYYEANLFGELYLSMLRQKNKTDEEFENWFKTLPKAGFQP